MSAGCHSCEATDQKPTEKLKIALWIALVLNALMFFAEFYSSFTADSVSLKADAIDFFGDSANYAVSLFVTGMSLQRRAIASFLKALTMSLFGVWVIGAAAYNAITISFPEPRTMGLMGLVAMIVNLVVAIILFKFKDNDSNMKSVWLCTRNDVIGNIALMLAASGVFLATNRWPDLVVAFFMGALALQSSYVIIKIALKELHESKHKTHSTIY